MSPDEINVKIKAMLDEAGYKDHMVAYIIPPKDDKEKLLAMMVHMTQVNALHLITELARKLPALFNMVVMNQIVKEDVARTEENDNG
jgi:hypothetical protein